LVLDFVTVVLLLLEASLDASLQNQVKDVKFETGKAINCSNMIQANYVDTIISAVLVLMLMMVLLRYLAQIIPFLARFLGIVNKVKTLFYFKFLFFLVDEKCFHSWNNHCNLIFIAGCIWNLYLWTIFPSSFKLFFFLYSSCIACYE